MTILTQNLELVNFDRVSYITVWAGLVEDTEAWTVIALDALPPFNDQAGEYSPSIQLGIYDTEEDCFEIINSLKAAIAAGKNIFEMPEPTDESLPSSKAEFILGSDE